MNERQQKALVKKIEARRRKPVYCYMIRDVVTGQFVGAGLSSNKPVKIWKSLGDARRAISMSYRECSPEGGFEIVEFQFRGTGKLFSQYGSIERTEESSLDLSVEDRQLELPLPPT